jgi:hypothetical protein
MAEQQERASLLRYMLGTGYSGTVSCYLLRQATIRGWLPPLASTRTATLISWTKIQLTCTIIAWHTQSLERQVEVRASQLFGLLLRRVCTSDWQAFRHWYRDCVRVSGAAEALRHRFRGRTAGRSVAVVDWSQ